MSLPSPRPAKITGSIVREIEAVASIVRITERDRSQDGEMVALRASPAFSLDVPPIALWMIREVIAPFT